MKNLNMLHLNGLRAVEAVARLGSLQAAAEEMSVTIGAVSQQVIKAEAQLGRSVFLRQPKGMVPLDAARPMLARLTEGFRALSQGVALGRPADENLLTVSVAPVFAARFLVHRLESFSRRHPLIRLRIEATTALADLNGGDVDLAIRVGRGVWPGVYAELLMEQRVFPVCTPALAADLRAPADILRLPAIIDGPSAFSWDIWLQQAGLAFQSSDDEDPSAVLREGRPFARNRRMREAKPPEPQIGLAAASGGRGGAAGVAELEDKAGASFLHLVSGCSGY